MLAVILATAFHHTRKTHFEFATIYQASERVMGGLVVELLRQEVGLGDIDACAPVPDKLSLLVKLWFAADTNNYFRTIRARKSILEAVKRVSRRQFDKQLLPVCRFEIGTR